MSNASRLRRLNEFLKSSIGQYDALQYEVSINDDSDPTLTAYEVKVTNTTNNKVRHLILRPFNNKIQILKGDEFYTTSAADTFAYLFMCEYLTYAEV